MCEAAFCCRIEFVTKKGKIGGDKRKMSFTGGMGDNMVVKTSGLITKDAMVSIGQGLPNTTSMSYPVSIYTTHLTP